MNADNCPSPFRYFHTPGSTHSIWNPLYISYSLESLKLHCCYNGTKGRRPLLLCRLQPKIDFNTKVVRYWYDLLLTETKPYYGGTLSNMVLFLFVMFEVRSSRLYREHSHRWPRTAVHQAARIHNLHYNLAHLNTKSWSLAQNYKVTWLLDCKPIYALLIHLWIDFISTHYLIYSSYTRSIEWKEEFAYSESY